MNGDFNALLSIRAWVTSTLLEGLQAWHSAALVHAIEEQGMTRDMAIRQVNQSNHNFFSEKEAAMETAFDNILKKCKSEVKRNWKKDILSADGIRVSRKKWQIEGKENHEVSAELLNFARWKYTWLDTVVVVFDRRYEYTFREGELKPDSGAFIIIEPEDNHDDKSFFFAFRPKSTACRKKLWASRSTRIYSILQDIEEKWTIGQER